MNEEEIMKYLESYIQFFSVLKVPEPQDAKMMKAIKGIIDLYNKQQKELKDLKEIEQVHKEENGKLRVELEKEKQLIFKIRNEVKDKLVVKDSDKEYRPCKNLTKQEVYKSFYAINLLLKGNYIFKSNETFTKELLEE